VPRGLALGLVIALAATAQLAPSRASAENMGEPMHAAFLPSAIRFSPDGRLFVTELWSGVVRVFPDTLPNTTSTVWATVPIWDVGERGLLSVAFHPQFTDSPFVYICYSDPADSANRVMRYRDTGTIGIDPVEIFRTSARSYHHNGGRLAFGPDDMLYVTYGDQDNDSTAQNLQVMPGKLFRLTPMGEPAPDNPVLGGLPEIFTFGHRNVFGIAFDRVTGQGYITENGPECQDEINALLPGGNYGWRAAWDCAVGQTFGIQPLVQYTPTIGPTGCWVYRGSAMPGLQGNLFFGAFNDTYLRRVVFHPTDPFQVEFHEIFWTGNDEQVLDVTEGPDGKLWVATAYSIVRIAPDKALVGVADGPRHGWLRVRPNPSSGAVTLAFDSAEAVRSIEIWDVAGRLVRRLGGGERTWTWDGRDGDGRRAAAGIYLVRVRTDARDHLARIIRLAP
jgi:glucose/arabinose dehydrogenase